MLRSCSYTYSNTAKPATKTLVPTDLRGKLKPNEFDFSFCLWDRGSLNSNENVPFNTTSTSSVWPSFSEADNNTGENIAELRANRAIFSGCPGCEHFQSSSKSPGKVTHITWGGGWFLSGISCFNNTAIVIFASVWAETFGGWVKVFQGFQNQFFMSFIAFRENCCRGM